MKKVSFPPGHDTTIRTPGTPLPRLSRTKILSKPPISESHRASDCVTWKASGFGVTVGDVLWEKFRGRDEKFSIYKSRFLLLQIKFSQKGEFLG
ncbi:MAG: hypothetical protein F6K39_08575 [Okeania sp. SIO3B3]|nr:hypothetical protein [Okeania sp. SIO3B3]